MNNGFYYNALAVEHGGDYEALKKLWCSCDGNWVSAYGKYKENNPVRHNPEKEWEKLECSGTRLVLLDDKEYPLLLKETLYHPLGIYIRGNLEIFRDIDISKFRNIKMPKYLPIAIVGTRRATDDGKATARRFASELARAGFTIISGLAFGIDAAAHEGCLDAHGTTIAVLASGTDVISPRTNDRLAKRILENGGAIISEYPHGSEPFPYRFLERNRIISGLSKGVLVIEAPESSGALATIRFAIEENRDVFVVPGPITHPNFVGSHNLIRNGAELVAKPEHIMETYGIIQNDISAEKENNCSPEEKLILSALRDNASGTDVDKIITMTKLEIQTANQALSFLLIKEIIKETGSGYAIKTSS